MNGKFSRSIGLLLMFGAILGMLLSVGSGFLLWREASETRQNLTFTAVTIGDTIETTSSLLNVVDETLKQVDESVALIEASLADTALSLKNTAGVTDSIGDLLGEDMTLVLQETQKALNTTQNSARLIDDTLKIVSAIPFIGARYDPEVTLQASIAQVADSLDPLPAALADVQDGMQTASVDLGIVQADMEKLSETIGKMTANLGTTRELVGSYQGMLTQLSESFARFEEKLPGRITAFYILATAFLVWLFISQLGLLTQGLERIAQPAGEKVKES